MKRIFGTIALMGLFAMIPAFGQNPNTTPQQQTPRGEMKQSGSEVKAAGKGMGREARHGHMVSGSKTFGKHMGRAGKHFGSGVKKGAKRATS